MITIQNCAIAARRISQRKLQERVQPRNTRAARKGFDANFTNCRKSDLIRENSRNSRQFHLCSFRVFGVFRGWKSVNRNQHCRPLRLFRDLLKFDFLPVRPLELGRHVRHRFRKAQEITALDSASPAVAGTPPPKIIRPAWTFVI